MSKIGRKPITFSSAKIEVDGNKISIKGPKTTVDHELPPEIAVKIDDNKLVLELTANTKEARALWGLHRALLANKVNGVENGFEFGLKIEGLGYKAQLSGKKLIFSLGYSHKIEFV